MDSSHLDFALYAPPADLRETVAGIWMASGRAVAPSEVDPVAPDGSVEVVINLGDPFARFTARGIEVQPRLLIAGQMLGPVAVGPTGHIDVVGIRLRPQATGRVLGCPPALLRDAFVPADAVLGMAIQQLADALSHCRTTAARLAAIGRHLRPRISPAGGEPSPALDWAIDRIQRSGGRIPVQRLADEVGTGRRQIERLFTKHVGLTPKEYGRIVRVQRVLALLAQTPRGNGAFIAGACGFADQSHMIREVQALAGIRPGELVTGTFADVMRTPATE